MTDGSPLAGKGTGVHVVDLFDLAAPDVDGRHVLAPPREPMERVFPNDGPAALCPRSLEPRLDWVVVARGHRVRDCLEAVEPEAVPDAAP